MTFTGTLQNATVEADEPLLYFAVLESASVWWSWTASRSGPVTLEVLNSSTNVFKLGGLEAWTGTNWSTDFTFVGATMLDSGRHPFFTFSATAGTTYEVRAVGTNFGNFTLRLTETNVPIIVVQPRCRTVSVNESVFFGIIAAGAPPSSPPLTYQWRFNEMDLPGETYPILSLDYLTTNQSGNYSVVVSNASGRTISAIAGLTVTEAASPPRLMPIGAADGQFEFSILGDPGRLYRIQSSTNLVNWVEEKSFPKEYIYYGNLGKPRNSVLYNDQSILSVPQSSSQKFYRVAAYVPPNAVCINNLAKIRFAFEIWAHEHKVWGYESVTEECVVPYVRPGNLFCPLDPGQSIASSYTIIDVMSDPLCMIGYSSGHVPLPVRHVLEEPRF